MKISHEYLYKEYPSVQNMNKKGSLNYFLQTAFIEAFVNSSMIYCFIYGSKKVKWFWKRIAKNFSWMAMRKKKYSNTVYTSRKSFSETSFWVSSILIKHSKQSKKVK